MKNGNSSNVSTHLKKIHQIESMRSKKMLKRKKILQGLIILTKKRDSFKTTLQRFYAVECTKESRQEDVICDADICNVNCLGNDFFRKKLNSKAIKHHIIEIYDATKGVFIDTIRQEVGLSALPILHLNVDLWTSKV